MNKVTFDDYWLGYLAGHANPLTRVLHYFGWHPYAGLFKRVRTTDFARNDTWLYSPGCVLAGLGFLQLAWEG